MGSVLKPLYSLCIYLEVVAMLDQTAYIVSSFLINIYPPYIKINLI